MSFLKIGDMEKDRCKNKKSIFIYSINRKIFEKKSVYICIYFINVDFGKKCIKINDKLNKYQIIWIRIFFKFCALFSIFIILKNNG